MLTVMPYDRRAIDRLARLLARYSGRLPHAKVMPAEFYTYHPAAAEGGNAVAVYDDRGEMAGFAPVIGAPVEDAVPAAIPHSIWSVMLVDPEQTDPAAVRECLYTAVLARSHALAATYPPRWVRLAADLMLCQQDEIADLRRRGFAPFTHVLVMARALDTELPPVRALPGVVLDADRLASAAAQAHCLAAYNVCFPHAPKTPDDLRFMLASPPWEQGYALTAAAGAELIGSVLVYATETPGLVMVDDVFVLPAWRGQGLARSVLAAALQRARSAGMTAARLEVDAANTPAVALYRGAGFAVVDEETLLGLDLVPAAAGPTSNRSEETEP